MPATPATPSLLMIGESSAWAMKGLAEFVLNVHLKNKARGLEVERQEVASGRR